MVLVLFKIEGGGFLFPALRFPAKSWGRGAGHGGVEETLGHRELPSFCFAAPFASLQSPFVGFVEQKVGERNSMLAGLSFPLLQ